MMALLERLKLNYDDYLAMPADGRRHEILDGEHFVTPAPATRHQLAVIRLAHALMAWQEGSGEGQALVAPCDVVLSEHDVVQPDLLWISSERLSILTPDNIQGAPDLVIEVLSPTSRRTDEHLKLALYERFGVREYWLVDPDAEQVKVRRRVGTTFAPSEILAAEHAATLTSALLPGFSLPVARLFGSSP